MSPSSPDNLEFTGERFTPECVREIHYEHIHRYALASRWVRGKNVLDAACGEGYGSAILARHAVSVTGVDLSAAAIEHAIGRYAASNLSFSVADCTRLPFADGQFDCIVSFETLEHLEQQEQMLAEFRRVLAADGFLVISSPDKAVYTDQQGNQNLFHRRELYRPELEALLGQVFPAVRLLGQGLAFHSVIWPLDDAGEDVAGRDAAAWHDDAAGEPAAAAIGCRLQQERPDPVSQSASQRASQPASPPASQSEIVDVSAPALDAVYLLALCAGEVRHLPSLDAALWLFDDVDQTVYRHYQHEIRKNMAAGALLAARDEEIRTLKQRLEESAAPAPTAPSRWRRWLGIR